MKRHGLALLLTACIAVSLLCIFLSGCEGGLAKAAPVSEPGKYSDIAAELDDYMTAYNENSIYKYIGTILVAKGDEILLNKGYGMANYEEKIPNDPGKVFGIGSCSKSFTAVAILQLQEKGLLNVNDPISKYIDGNKRGDDITIHQLLTHTSGMPRDGLRMGTKDIPFQKNIDFINAAQLLFEPGEKYSYSNEGYIMLAAIIEKVTGQPYNDYIRDNIFRPLNMNSSRCGTDDSYGDNQARAYEILTDEPRSVPLASFSYATGCGNLYSTTEDLYKYDRALHGEKLLSKESLDKMFTSYSDEGYGYGWGVSQRFDRSEISHNGHIEGYNAAIMKYPNDDAVLIFLSNNNDSKALDEVSGNMAALVLGQDYVMPEKVNAVAINPEIIKKYAGVYELDGGLSSTIKYSDGKLYEDHGDGHSYELLPVSDNEFRIKIQPSSGVTFILDENSNPVGIKIYSAGTIYQGKKVK